MSDIIHHSRPTVGKRERDAVMEVFSSNQLAQGPQVDSLEWEAAEYFGHPGAVAVGSGSQALLLALKSLDLGEGCRVALPAYTCSAVLHCVEWSGAEPVLLDLADGKIAPEPSALDELNDPVDAAIVVHPWGYPLDASAWRQKVSIVIEDCAQSIGAAWAGQPVGAAGNVAIVSFYATKMLCAGEGGLLSSQTRKIADRARDLRDYDGKPEYARRFNFKMSDMQAALARIQLSRLPEFLEKRKLIAARYDSEVEALGLTPVTAPSEATCSNYRYICRVFDNVSPLLDFCLAQGVHCRRPVPVTLDRLLKQPLLPNTLEAWNRLISLPVYPSLSTGEQDRVLEVLELARTKGLLA